MSSHRLANSATIRCAGRLSSSTVAPTTTRQIASNHHLHTRSSTISLPTSPSPILRRGYHVNNLNISTRSFNRSSRLRLVGDNNNNISMHKILGSISSDVIGDVISIRTIGSTPRLLDDDNSAEPKPKVVEEESEVVEGSGDTTDVDDDDDPCPPWQNPLHHNNPDFQKVLAEDFEPGEEMPVVPLPPFETEENEGKVLASPELHALADEVVRLNMIEVAELVDRIGSHFGLEDDDGYPGDDGGGGDGDAVEEEVVEEKTVFDLKLTGFDAKSKIKVIKEIRSVTSLGLKEAKELVEGAPVSFISSHSILCCLLSISIWVCELWDVCL